MTTVLQKGECWILGLGIASKGDLESLSERSWARANQIFRTLNNTALTFNMRSPSREDVKTHQHSQEMSTVVPSGTSNKHHKTEGLGSGCHK